MQGLRFHAQRGLQIKIGDINNCKDSGRLLHTDFIYGILGLFVKLRTTLFNGRNSSE